MIRRRTESNDILLELVAKTLAVGAYEMQVERHPPTDCTVRLRGDWCLTKSDLEIRVE